MVGSDSEQRTGRYSFEMVSGHLRQKSHESDVQKALNEGASRGWELVNASYAYSGSHITALVWDTSPRR